MIYQKEFKIRANEIQNNQYVSNRALMSYLEATASEHSDSDNLGISSIETKKKTWIILEWKVEIIERPKYLETILVKTWAQFKKDIYSYRDFEVINSEGKLIAKASSKWVLLDTQRGKIIKIEEDFIKRNSEKGKQVFETLEIEKLKEPETIEYVEKYVVRRSEIDINGHMNNLRYLDVAKEIVPEEIYNQGEKNNIRITYRKEIKCKEVIECSYSKENDRIKISLKTQNEKKSNAIIELW